MASCFRSEDYTVGWICALPAEFNAARAMLDEEHDSDNILYALGSIGGLKVAILRIVPGKGSVLDMASLIGKTYTKIRFLVMVGTGSGVPSSDVDIRIGDVVVSIPPFNTIQYNIGKGSPDRFTTTIVPGNPADIVEEAYADVCSTVKIGRSSTEIPEQVSKSKLFDNFAREGIVDDILFEAAYDHEGGETCDWCSTDRRKMRMLRDSADPKVFCGGTAFGNEFVRNGRIRDSLSKEIGSILCFQTEVSGELANFPSIVCHGICDYADSHRNERFRLYAAGNAAAYAKLLLLKIHPQKVNLYTRTTMEGLCNRYLARISNPERGPEHTANFDSRNIPTSALFLKGQHLKIDDPTKLTFRIIKQLGKGGSAVVNMVEDSTVGRKFAHKTFGTFSRQSAFEKAKQSFYNEIEIMKRLSFNPHVIEVFATYTCGRELGMLLLPVASDGNLEDYLVRIMESATGPTVEQQTTLHRSFGCLASGLAYIHKRTIRHKDVKPQNILIHYGRIIYTDFGLALDASHQDTTTVGRPDGFTRRYCAPEVAEWGQRNRKSDIFSLGCVFVEVLAALVSDPTLNADDSTPYWNKLDTLRDKLLRASTSESSFDELFHACYNMLHLQQENRPSAESLLLTISKMTNSLSYFCGNCARELKPHTMDPTEHDPVRSALSNMASDQSLSEDHSITSESRAQSLSPRTSVSSAEVWFELESSELGSSEHTSSDENAEEEDGDPALHFRNSRLSRVQAINDSIRQAIRDTLWAPLSMTSQAFGYIYILYSLKYKSRVYIGRTSRKEFSVRKEDWERHFNQKFEATLLLANDEGPIRHAARVERLVHTELQAFQITLKCNQCSRQHHEWFRTSLEHATKVCNKYSDWIATKPYKAPGWFDTDKRWKLNQGISHDELEKLCTLVSLPPPLVFR